MFIDVLTGRPARAHFAGVGHEYAVILVLNERTRLRRRRCPDHPQPRRLDYDLHRRNAAIEFTVVPAAIAALLDVQQAGFGPVTPRPASRTIDDIIPGKPVGADNLIDHVVITTLIISHYSYPYHDWKSAAK